MRQFCFESESLLLYDRASPEKGYKQRSVNRAFQSFHANTIEYENGEKTDLVEKWFAESIDSPLGGLLDSAARHPEEFLQPNAKRILAKYLLSLLLRSPSVREAILMHSDQYFSLAESVYRIGRFLGLNGETDLFGSGTPKDFRRALVKSLPTIGEDEFVDFLVNSELVIAQPAGHEVFCLCDFPMMRYDDHRNASEEMMHEYWFMLGPKSAACFLANTTLNIGGAFLLIPDSHVRKLNFDFAMRSQFVASNCPVALHQTVRNLGFYSGDLNLETTEVSIFEKN